MDRAGLQLSRRKVRDRSIALVLAGSILLMPPIIGISLIEGTIGGLPAPLLYVFIVWSGLIAGAAALAGPLLDTEDSPSQALSPSSTEPTRPDS
jgi:hypothetical protein